ncbi:hypothetical protein RCMEACHAM_39 [Rhodobacter phage RcMeacham]|nr:hypothetical protein RCMAMADUCK_39 [Rhodobacter phage RcMamaDuck]UUV44341.1 hypothetical protein RCMEACHAM_39 [Rhodobacter phage RcMeacham]
MMVALHNRRLTQRDLWPDLLWDDEQRFRLIDQLRAAMIAEGWNFEAGGVEAARAGFELSKRIDADQNRFPSYGERQAIIRALYPGRRAPAPFSLEQLAAIRDRFSLDNDPDGLAIAQRAADLIAYLGGGE